MSRDVRPDGVSSRYPAGDGISLRGSARGARDAKQPSIAAQLFAGEGEMRRRARVHDWAATPLGPVDRWPQSLRTTATTVLATDFPAILLWGPRLVQLYNDAYAPFLGVKHPTGFGTSAPSCWPELWPEVEPIVERVLAGETVTLVDQHYPLLRRDGESAMDDVYITLSYVPVRDESGSVSGVLVTGLDTTGQLQSIHFEAERSRFMREHEELVAQAESARRAAEAALEQAGLANRAKGAFLAVISHELRTPLTAIGGYAEIMEMGLRGPVSADQLRDLHGIQLSQRHLLRLIGQVLDHARVEMGTVRYDLADVAVADALFATEGLVAPQLRGAGLTYSVVSCDPALQVRADPGKLQQVLLNLVGNSVKFTDAGGQVTVRCGANDDMVEISVEDTGIGIAPDKLAAVFEPFVQVQSDITRNSSGVGLGLAISREMARGMGGELAVTSEPGRGSTFTLTLPRAGRPATGPAAR
jgi:signal transduction histidine kinase